MKFYIEEYKTTIHQVEYPCVILTNDDWDDYFKGETLFHARYKDGERTVFLGDVKIMTTQGSITRRIIEKEFTELNLTYCSLGQTLDYYKKISEFAEQEQKEILEGLRDCATNEYIAREFKNNSNFKDTLLRFSEAEKAFKEANKFFGGNVTKSFKFEFICQLKSATSPHVVKLDFSESKLPYRINAFVGKNATGKTKVLTELANYLSGVKLNKENFQPERPSFSKVITLSYSAFDELYKPFEDIQTHSNDEKEESKLFSYKYCGLRDKKGVLSLVEIEKQFSEAYTEVLFRDREYEWKKIMQNVFEEEHLELIEKIQKLQVSQSLNSFLSSGQNILLYTITDVIANIEDDSLLLFDEPEIHLHPNAIANFMRMFYEVLEQFKSYAIISTHSPIILQEIPSKYVRVFSRIENTPLIESPILECFGESISNITNDIFEVRELESNYKTYLKRMSKRFDKEEIIELFEDDLSFNALTYLNAIYKRKDLE